MVRKIIQIGNELLVKKSKELAFPLSNEDKNLITDLLDTARSVGDKAAGLSAPQLGVNKRVAICRRIDVEELVTKLNDQKYIPLNFDIVSATKKLIANNDILVEANIEKAVSLLKLSKVEKKVTKPDLVTMFNKADDLLWLCIINPVVTFENDYETIYWEGCLSVGIGKNALYAPIPRTEVIDFEYFNMRGEKIKMRTSNYFAHAILHEIDHLNGVLFISLVDNIKNIWKSGELDEYIKLNKKYPDIIE